MSGSPPGWASRLLRIVAPTHRVDEVLGDLEEAHRTRVARRGRWLAGLLTSADALDVAWALLRERVARRTESGGDGGPPIQPVDAPSGGPRISWLDFKLGIRMLVRYPGLTVVGGLAMAFGIAVGAGTLQVLGDAAFPALPYAGAERLVELRNVSAREPSPDPRALHSFVEWRRELASVEELTALDNVRRNLALNGETGEAVLGSTITASAFELLPVPPRLGRPLLPGDEAEGARPVVVISHDLWQDRFAADPDVVGRVIRLDGEPTTVVGVMPDGFEFPLTSAFWIPLRLDPLAHAPGDGPSIAIVGRLAGNASLESAQTELDALGAAAATRWPATHGHLRPRIEAFPPSALDALPGGSLMAMGLFTLIGAFFVGLMVLVCANVALLLFSRAAAREGELAVRSALGASRGRIVFQLFAEALALAGLSTIVGLIGASVGLRWVFSVFEAQGDVFPSWIRDTLSPTTIGYAAVLALVGATVAGVLPGLQVTGRGAQAGLQRLAGRGSGPRLGRLWPGIVVTQVALTVLFLPIVIWVGFDTWTIRNADRGLPAHEYLFATLQMDGRDAIRPGLETPEADVFRRDYAAVSLALVERLTAEPGVRAVTVAGQVPGGWHARRPVEVGAADVPPPGVWGNRTQYVSVDPNFFDVTGAEIVAGRGLDAMDVVSGDRVVVVNESFVRTFLGGRNAVGVRVRYPGASSPGGRVGADDPEPAPWHEIVGVVRDLVLTIDPDLPHNAGVYHPLRAGEAYPVQVVARVDGDPASYAGRLRELAAGIDPALRVERPRSLDRAAEATLVAYGSWFRVIVVAGALALLLTGAGIYAVLSYTVSRRTREIGVRVALGAERWSVVTTILSWTGRRVALGVLIGAGGFFLLVTVASGGWWWTTEESVMLAVSVAVMGAVCVLASVWPALRTLRVQPTEALKADG